MDGVFNTGLSFGQFIVVVLTMILGAIAIRVTFNFDVNKYLERRDRRLEQKLKNTCTHLNMEYAGQEEGKPLYKIQSLFESPSGTLQWQCQRCGLVRSHNNDYDKRAEYFAKNPDEYVKLHKKFQKLLKKNGAT